MPPPSSPSCIVPALLCAIVFGTVGTAQPAATGIDFARDIQPLLAGKCYDCHGAEKPKGGLQLTSRASALRGGESGEPAFVPGAGGRSEIIARVTTTDENDVMPQKGDPLTPAEVALLRRWIDEGAVWPEDLRHWAYVKPVRPAVPPVTLPGARVHNPIDAFVLARLAPAGLKPSPPADPARWLRRVSLDLIGLPPTPAEVDAFMADRRDDARERVVDRLLASPHYGERWARPWLDLARYADSHGFQRDDLRDLWPYRDWVVGAMNADMPFDQFTIWQIAGDLLPDARPSADRPDSFAPLVATGFHRAAPTNVEAGTDQEEGRVNQVFDRVNTTAAVWLGTTLECAQCHNHKYDPFSQQDYYRIFAFFNQTARETDFTTPKAMASLKFTGPYLTLPDPAKDGLRPALKAKLAALDRQVAERTREALAGLDRWESDASTTLGSTGEVHPLEIADFESTGGSVSRMLPDKSVLLVEEAPDRDTYIVTVKTTLTGITGFRLDALTDPSLPGGGPGRGDAARPNFVLNNLLVAAGPTGGSLQPVRLVRAAASFSQNRYAVTNLLRTDNDSRGGWAIGGQFQRSHWATFEFERPIGHEAGTTFTFQLVQNFGSGRTIGRFRISALTGRVDAAPIPAEIASILRVPKDRRTAPQTAKLRDHFLAQDPPLDRLRLERSGLERQLAGLQGPRTLVMRELDQPRPTHVLSRGNFLEPGEPVEPGTPAALHAAAPPSGPRGTRLDLARWLVDRENPLVARVTVNRWWAEFFGRGIVGTPEDFGVKGEAPTHPELLDWLAVEFMERGWSMKHVHRLIVLSATYGQSSRVSPELLAADDQNKLLARGPRFRLDAEAIRDNALAIAGLLSLKQGGPPVRPYQPPGLWENKVGGDRVTYEVSAGEDAWRRGLYTVWKRSSPYPSFMNFDATPRTACTVRRSRSNTPLQALTLLNDPVYVEAAFALARRVLAERPAAATAERLRHAFRLCVARAPADAELAALADLLAAQTAALGADPGAVQRLLGRQEPPAGATPQELAAWHAVATALLNLDETITKG